MSAAIRMSVVARSTIAADPAQLSDLERTHLATIRGQRRRDEGICGRLAIHRLLGDPSTSIVIDADGAPRPVGGRPCSVSLSHDGEWIAVAMADDDVRVGVDLCLREHAQRIERILAWLGVATSCDPVIAWTALEVALKLRRLSIEALRDRVLAVDAIAPDRVRVCGLGADVVAAVRREPAYVVAWGAA